MNKVTSALCVVSTAGLLLLACNKGEAQASPDTKPAAAPAAGALRQTITVDGIGFHPSEIPASAGQNLTLVFHRTTDATCGKEVVFKDLGIRKSLPLNQDVEINVKAAGTIGFACGMDMMKGAIVAR